MGLLFKVLGTVIFDRCSLYSFLFDSTKLKRINHPQMLSSNGVKNRDISTDSWGPAIYVALAFTDITHQYHTESKEYVSMQDLQSLYLINLRRSQISNHT